MPPIRTAEILTVGTELLLGEIDDTNSSRLAAQLAKRGVDVFWTQRVGDNLGRLRFALERALERSDLIVLTGGLGPTDDDLTRDAIAAALGATQRIDPELEATLRQRFLSMARSMPERNLRQAMLIPSAIGLPNPIGTAPGWLVRTSARALANGSPGGRPGGSSGRNAVTVAGAAEDDTPPGSSPIVAAPEPIIVTLPGPPREMMRMWLQEAVPRLEFPESRLFSRTFKTLGIGEGQVAEILGTLTDAANPSVATYAKRDGVHVRVAAKGRDRASAEALAAPVLKQVAETLGDSVWGTNEDELPTLVVEALLGAGKTLALVEVASAGALAEALGAVPRAPEAVRGAVIAYAPETMATLGVPSDLLARLPGAAADVVVALSAYVRAMFGTDLCVAVGPVSPLAGAGPDDDSGPDRNERAGTRVMIAIATNDATRVETLNLPPLGRAWSRERLAITSLALLRSTLR